MLAGLTHTLAWKATKRHWRILGDVDLSAVTTLCFKNIMFDESCLGRI